MNDSNTCCTVCQHVYDAMMVIEPVLFTSWSQALDDLYSVMVDWFETHDCDAPVKG